MNLGDENEIFDNEPQPDAPSGKSKRARRLARREFDLEVARLGWEVRQETLDLLHQALTVGAEGSDAHHNLGLRPDDLWSADQRQALAQKYYGKLMDL